MKTNCILSYLSGKKQKDTKSVFFKESSKVLEILKAGFAASAADKNGALNVWVDDDKKIRCQSMRYFITQDAKIYTDEKDVILWCNEWLNRIK